MLARLRKPLGLAALGTAMIVLGAAPGIPAPTTAEPPIGKLAPLREMISRAHAVVLAKTTAVKQAAEGSPRIYTIDVRRSITGEPTAKKLRLAESDPPAAAGRAAPPYLEKGQEAVVLLARRYAAPAGTSTGVPAGAYTAVGGRDGVIVLADHGDLAPIEAAIGNAEQLGPRETPGNTIARREHVRIEIESGQPRLILDALAEFERMDSLSAFALRQSKTIERIVRDRRLDAGLRASLIEVFSRKKAKPVLPILERLSPEDPDVFIVALYARAALGRPASTRELERYLATSDERVRAAAVRGLTFTGDPEAIEVMGKASSTDPAPSVRLAAIESLAATREQAALGWLTRSFASDRAELRHAAATAVVSIGGREADRALMDAALQGPTLDSRIYAAAVLLARLGPKHATVARLRRTSHDEQVRAMLAPPPR